MAAPLDEADVGITEYVALTPGFSAILKHRFRDFQVREVDPQGNVARLTSVEPPRAAAPPPISAPPESSATPGTDRVSEAAGAVEPAPNGIADLPLPPPPPPPLPPPRPDTGAAEAAAKGDEGEEAGFTAPRLEAARPKLVEAFGELAGAANGARLDALLRRVVESLAAAAGAGGSAASGPAAPTPGAEGVEATSPAAQQGSGPEAAAAGSEAGQAAAGPAAEAQVPARVEVEESRGGSLAVLLEPIAAKDVRKAVHDFFRSTPGLPPMVTTTVSAPDPAAAVGAGAEEGGERPTKRQRSEPQGGRGRGGGSGGGKAKPDPAAAVTVIRVSFSPSDLRGGGRGGGGRHRDGGGRGDWGRGGGRGSGRGDRRDRGGRGDRRGDGGEGGGGGGGGWGGGGQVWEGGSRRFVRFVLYKENMDTQVALSTVAKLAGIPNGGCFGFAGTKDKRGVTCQWVTAFKVFPARLAALNARLRGMRLGAFGFVDSGLKLGCLGGNEFELLLRDVRPEGGGAEAGGGAEETVARVSAACREVAAHGFINYFGLQRFGTGGSPTHLVGAALLRGDFERAARLVLTGRPGERADVASARAAFLDGGDVWAALRGLPHFMLGERAILNALARAADPSGNGGGGAGGGRGRGGRGGRGGGRGRGRGWDDGGGGDRGPAGTAPAAAGAAAAFPAGAWACALLAIPRTLRMMYLHAWQSGIWNAAASHRIRVYGRDRAVAGDLVLPRCGSGADADAVAEGGGDEDEDGAAAAAEADGAAGGEADGDGEGAGPAPGSASSRLSAVVLVTEEDERSGRYSVFDVVLPLPGTQVHYPQHETGAEMRRLALEAGVDLEAACAAASASGAAGGGRGGGGGGRGAAHELSFASLTGDYRRLLHKPGNFSAQLKRYLDPNDDSLAPTDLELLNRQPSTAPPVTVTVTAAADASSDPPGAGAADGTTPEAAAAGAGAGVAVSGEGPLLALSLRFRLPPSCYATMLLRELMKTSTSRTFHSGLSAAAAPAPAAAPGAAEAPGAAAQPEAPAEGEAEAVAEAEVGAGAGEQGGGMEEASAGADEAAGEGAGGGAEAMEAE
ncbi:hypothetical protein HYH03_015221 [Edaphochlamys debaryana]|uniref:TRUD domain-containing protein n=1 Tax=Edaphochlamys debaryana TaxID=47281 RepID=A0A835XMM8_9CHLO|nr:hypothetical protein HYH03_015221 [Edaphochlamys debaryana]|eukprot:KAG2486127.1 hypothetical protein HYH03_015221 [Edaphochlamys debaryana]